MLVEPMAAKVGHFTTWHVALTAERRPGAEGEDRRSASGEAKVGAQSGTGDNEVGVQILRLGLRDVVRVVARVAADGLLEFSGLGHEIRSATSAGVAGLIPAIEIKLWIRCEV